MANDVPAPAPVEVISCNRVWPSAAYKLILKPPIDALAWTVTRYGCSSTAWTFNQSESAATHRLWVCSPDKPREGAVLA